MSGETRSPARSAWRRLTRLLAPPDYPDQRDRRAAALAHAVLWVSFFGPLIYGLVTFSVAVSWIQRAPLLVAVAVPALGLWALRRGFLHQTSVALIATFLIVPVWGSLDSGGIRAPSVMTLFVAVLLAGQLLGVKAAMVASAVGALEVIGLVVASTRQWLGPPSFRHTDQSYAAAVVIELAVCGAFAALAARLVQNMLNDLRREQQAVRDVGEHLRESLEASPDAIVSLDVDGVVTQTNRAHELLLGRPREEIVGRHLTKVAPLSAENEALARARFAALLAGDQPGLVSATLQRPDGALVAVEANPRLVVRSDGSRTVEVVIRDVTERIEAERRQRDLEAQLDDARRLEYIGRLAGGVAHDFNNLLTVILGNAYEAGESQSLPPLARERFEAIRDAGERAARMTRQLLTFARRQEENPRLIALGQTLTETKALLRRLLPASIELRMEIERECAVRVDPAQLDQIVVNLVVNARDAVGAGGRITVGLRLATPAEAGSRPPLGSIAYAVLSVSDNGAGIDPGILKRIFEPFFTTKAPGKGTGLGLATVLSIARQSGGQVFVTSELAAGTCFEVFLPLAPGRPATREATRPPGLSGATIMVVDDEPEVRVTVARILTKEGFQVLEADSGDAARRLADGAIAPQLLLSDMHMPTETGLALARQLRQANPRLAVLFMSGYRGPDDGDWTTLPGAGFITKPFSRDDLMARISELLSVGGQRTSEVSSNARSDGGAGA